MRAIPRRIGSTAAVLLAAVLVACGSDDDDPPPVVEPPPVSEPPPVIEPPPAPDPGPLGFEESCAALAGSSVPSGSVTSARFVPAGTESNQPVPDHCLVQGRINERIGVDGKLYAIGFEVRLPREWNSRFFFQGAGGTVGTLGAARGSLPGAGPGPGGLPANALSRGFAVASSDAGHLNEAGPNGPYLFGVDPQARLDYGSLHLPSVSAAAAALMSTTYGSNPQYSYFAGCSNGGRQAMKATQLYPDLFDGVIVGAPAYRVARASVDAAAETQLFASIAQGQTPDGRPALWTAFTNEELALVSNGILQSCDALDGVADGMVNATSSCNFDPLVLQCQDANGAGCLAAEKVAVLDSIFSGLQNAQGEVLYSDWPWDPGIGDPGWRSWKLGSAPTAGQPQVPNAINTTLVAGALSHVFLSPPVITTDLYGFMLGFDVETDGLRIATPSGIYTAPATELVDATITDLDAYRSRGGKMVFYHGMADAIFSATDTVRYLRQLQDRYGDAGTDGFARLYLLPGMTHCAGGPATDQFELLEPLMRWVENGAVPETLTATARPNTPWPGRTRPLCVWPSEAIYNGSGSAEEAASFSCTSPPPG